MPVLPQLDRLHDGGRLQPADRVEDRTALNTIELHRFATASHRNRARTSPPDRFERLRRRVGRRRGRRILPAPKIAQLDVEQQLRWPDEGPNATEKLKSFVASAVASLSSAAEDARRLQTTWSGRMGGMSMVTAGDIVDFNGFSWPEDWLWRSATRRRSSCRVDRPARRCRARRRIKTSTLAKWPSPTRVRTRATKHVS